MLYKERDNRLRSLWWWMCSILIVSCALMLHPSEGVAADKKAGKKKPIKASTKAPVKAPEKAPQKTTEQPTTPAKVEQPAETPAAAAEPEKKSGSNLLSEGLGLKGKGKSDQPLYIKSKTLDLDAKARIFTYRGDVVATQEDLTITSDIMIGKYDEKNQLQTITCEKNVVITRGPALKAISNRAVYNVPKSIIHLTEGPELVRDGNALSADKVTIYVNEDKSEAEGNVQVKVVKADEAAAAAKNVTK